LNKSIRKHATNVKKILLTTKPAGEGGFEGLMAVVLAEICGVPFRLASSGSQFGIDGKVAYKDENISFEAKRYDGSIQRTALLSKIAEISINGQVTDIWIVGATTAVSTQLADDIEKFSEMHGIATLILDWSGTNLPPLLVCMAMCEIKVGDFFRSIGANKPLVSLLELSLSAISKTAEFDSHAKKIRSSLSIPNLGMSLALRANSTWLSAIFSNKSKARNKLGQPLSPYDENGIDALERSSLTKSIETVLLDKNSENLIVVKGNEGCGKSWIVAQCWWSILEKPLMVILKPEEFSDLTYNNIFEEIFLSNLIEQTGDVRTDASFKRWQRRLKNWRVSPQGGLRFIVVIDGINQRPGTDWGRIIDIFVDESSKLGGKLVVTTRTQYYTENVRNRIISSPFHIILPEWTDEERNEILSKKEIDVSGINPIVAASLKNPRLLGIAIELLDTEDISELEELSVSRLMFEHMRISDRDSTSTQPFLKFALDLQDHAQEIINRIELGTTDDIAIFSRDLQFVIDGRFFIPVEGDPTSYTIGEDGISLALGLSIISQVNKALRNRHNMDSELERILAPIGALDQTAKAILAALTIISIDESYEKEMGVSLICAFSGLQNVDGADFMSFSAIAEKMPEIFMQSAEKLCLVEGVQQNFDWVEAALMQASMKSKIWEKMKFKVKRWLCNYSLSPEVGMMRSSSRDSVEEVQVDRDKNEEKLNLKIASLSAVEKKFQNSLIEIEGDLNSLWRLAFNLLTGKQLTEFSKEIVLWRFAISLNSNVWSPRRELEFLIRFNCMDWAAMRSALLSGSRELDNEEISVTGKWAFVAILDSTGDCVDALDARKIVSKLRQPSNFQGGSSVESYCSVDPCDPGTTIPKNVNDTAKKFGNIEVQKISRIYSSTSEDYFFVNARLSVARFVPKVAIDKHLDFCADIFDRKGMPLRQGLLELENHTALLSRKLALQLVKKYRNRVASGDFDGLPGEVNWISGYILQIAFPFLSGKEQIDILLSDPVSDELPLALMDVAKPFSENEFESLFDVAYKGNDEESQFVLLGVANETNTAISGPSMTQIGALLEMCSGRVLAQILRYIAKSKNELLIKKFVNSQWATSTDKSNETWENWYGSWVLIEAVELGVINLSEVIGRISPRFYGRAAYILGSSKCGEIARYVDASIQCILNLDTGLVIPDIEMNLDSEDSEQLARYSVRRKTSEPTDIKEMFREMNGSIEEFDIHQNRALSDFEAFKEKLTSLESLVILDRFRLKEFKNIVDTDSDLASKWYEFFMELPESKLGIASNIIVLLAYSLVGTDTTRSVALFRKIQFSSPYVHFTYGEQKISLCAMAIWSGADHSELNTLRFQRLDIMNNDHDLALEIGSALLNGKQSLLEQYISNKLSNIEPSEIARGIMVAGLSDSSPYNEDVLNQFRDSSGFLKDVYEAANFAYERNLWAKQWYSKMCEVNQADDFWRFTLLFMKIVDGRFEVWNHTMREEESVIRQFWPSVSNKYRNRLEKWKRKREKKLFGQDAPSSMLLEYRFGPK
jgi:hypothetical protein